MAYLSDCCENFTWTSFPTGFTRTVHCAASSDGYHQLCILQQGSRWSPALQYIPLELMRLWSIPYGLVNVLPHAPLTFPMSLSRKRSEALIAQIGWTESKRLRRRCKKPPAIQQMLSRQLFRRHALSIKDETRVLVRVSARSLLPSPPKARNYPYVSRVFLPTSRVNLA